MKKIYFTAILVSALSACTQSPADDCCKYVNPFIGSAWNGHTFPGATVPFGFIQASPETGNDSWKYCSGYNYDDSLIIGFAQNHLNGTGCLDLGDVLMLPFTEGDISDGRYAARFDKSAERATPGYYAVHLSDFDIDVELTATQRTALHRYTFHKDAPAALLLDLQNGLSWNAESVENHVLQAEINFPDENTVSGHQQVQTWVRRHFYYVVEFNRPYTVSRELPPRAGNKAKRLLLSFDLAPGEQLLAKVAISGVSIDGAKQSLEKENPSWEFEKIADNAARLWNDIFNRVKITGDDDQKTNFYTAMYHLFIQPNDIADTDGRYRGADDEVHVAPSGRYYSTLSLWDTYRAAHPLYTILSPEYVDGFVQSMLEHCKAQKYLPIWTLWGRENHCMIANHSVPVIVDACLKGFRGFDHNEAFDAIKTSLTVAHVNSPWNIYTRYGYYPCNLVHESVSKTLECVYDDYCAARLAAALGKTDDCASFSRRAEYYKNLYDPASGLMRGKDSAGVWRTPFEPYRLASGDFTEGNAWQYAWHVQHDPEGLIALMGGESAFTARLDSLFFVEVSKETTGFVSDVTGLIGQYAHGNEPSHHVVYLYALAGEAYKTQSLVREVFDRFYLNKPDGLCGNDDCGQMSAWYIFSAMGFYPVNPVGGEYVLGAPQIPSVEIALPAGKTFTVEALNLSPENKYVASVTLNGQPYTDSVIRHNDIMNGGKLVFTMCDTPER